MHINRLVKIFVLAGVTCSASVSAESLEGFISSNHDLNENVEARMLVKQEASLMAYSEALSEGVENTEGRRKEILMQDGEKYGALAIKKMNKFCSGSDVSFVAPSQPDEETCKFFLRLK